MRNTFCKNIKWPWGRRFESRPSQKNVLDLCKASSIMSPRHLMVDNPESMQPQFYSSWAKSYSFKGLESEHSGTKNVWADIVKLIFFCFMIFDRSYIYIALLWIHSPTENDIFRIELPWITQPVRTPAHYFHHLISTCLRNPDTFSVLQQ